MPFKEHVSKTLKLEKAPSPWPRMILCSLSVGLPLFLGAFRQELRIAIFGSLFGYILILNDHFASYKRRITHLLTCYFFIALSFLLGATLVEHEILTGITLFIFSFILGLSKSRGIELERMILICSLQFLMASGSPQLKGHYFGPLFYTSLSFINYIVCLSAVYLLMKHTPNFSNSKRDIFKKIIHPRNSFRFGFTCAITTCIGYFIAKWFRIDHDYWVPGTILIVMMPDQYQSLYRGAQRLLGTIIGVVIAAFMIKYAYHTGLLIFFSMVFAFFTPYGLIRNYWLGNAFVAGLILFLLEIANSSHSGSMDIAILRIKDISLGCLIGMLATLIAHPEMFIKSKVSDTKD